MLYLLFFLVLCTPFQGHAEVYKWIDEQGQTHYGERPAGGDATAVKIQDTPTADTAMQKQNEERDKMLKIYEEERNIKNEEKRKADEENRKRAEQCRVAENELKDMQQGGAMYYDLDDKGERRYLSDAEISRRIKELEAQYNQYCK